MEHTGGLIVNEPEGSPESSTSDSGEDPDASLESGSTQSPESRARSPVPSESSALSCRQWQRPTNVQVPRGRLCLHVVCVAVLRGNQFKLNRNSFF